ncbi:MAG: TonB-dependent receptor [Azonexus sp.]
MRKNIHTQPKHSSFARHPLSLALAALWLGLPALPAMAAEEPVFALGEVKVVASPDGRDSLGSTTLDLDDIRDNNRNTVGTALDMVPGVNASRFGARNEQTVFVRGFDSRQVPLFVDGIPVYVPYDGYVDLARFTTFDLSRIEVAKGFSSMVYGPNTLGGAINLISRRPSKAFEGEIGGGFTFDSTGENNGYHGYTNVGTNQGMWYAQFSASYADQDYFRIPDSYSATAGEDGGKRNNSYSSDRKYNLKLGLTPNATDEYAINYINQHGTKGTPPYAGSVAGITPRYWQWPYWDKESLYLLTTTAIGEHRIKFRAYHDTFRNSLFSFDNANYNSKTRPYAFESWYDDYTDGLSIEGDFRLAAVNQLKVAYHFKEDVHREHDKGQPIRRFRDQTQSFNIEDSHQFTDRLALVTGLGYDQRQTQDAQDYNSTTGVISDFRKNNNDALNAQAGLIFKTSTSGRLQASIAQKSRFPTIKERYSYRMGRGIPNADLKTEEALHYELGYSDHISSSLLGEVRVFHSDIDNLIQSVVIAPTACTSAPCSQSQNVSKASADGFELSVRGEVLRNVDIATSYSYLDRRNRSGDGLFLTDTPHHNLFAALTWRPTDAIAISTSVNAMSRRYSSSDGKQIAPGFAVANLKAGYRFANGLLLEAGINNLFDKLYYVAEGYPEAGRTFFTNFNLPL